MEKAVRKDGFFYRNFPALKNNVAVGQLCNYFLCRLYPNLYLIPQISIEESSSLPKQ